MSARHSLNTINNFYYSLSSLTLRHAHTDTHTRSHIDNLLKYLKVRKILKPFQFSVMIVHKLKKFLFSKAVSFKYHPS